MHDINHLKETIKEILDSQKLSVLATQTNKGPYGSLMAYAATSDLKKLLFAATRATRKYSNLLAHADVAMIIDTRTNQVADFADAVAITVLGEAEEVAAHERKEFLNIYLEKHLYLKEFVESPNCSLFKLKVKKYIMVNKFQNVQELYVIE